ncbi:MAG: cell division protein FtsW [Proteobacteria bacterium]|nr:cell division protein FtsW [Pseudomonadota bacterium]
MIGFARTDNSVLSRWWWTVDRWTLAALLTLICFGLMLILAASPAVAERIGLESFHFVRRQVAYLGPALATILAISLLSPRDVRRLGTIVFAVALVLMALTLVAGTEINGARRWLNIFSLSLQPSEIMKPGFAVLAAWMISAGRLHGNFPGYLIVAALYLVVMALLLMQPDMGMAGVISAVLFAQFFLAGPPLLWVGLVIVLGLSALVGAYYAFPHVASRVNSFLDPSAGDSYQVNTALEAFMNGGVLGRGPGEGTIKEILPDAHSDFIFAVAGEELGLFACLVILALFAFVVLRGFSRMLQENNLFVLLAVTGLLVQFGLQTAIHMATTLKLMPTKGMTLPFISYGGSSLFGIALAMGMVLALTRRRVGLRGV